MICGKCGERCYSGGDLGEHMKIHERTCLRCGNDHSREDEHTIMPLTHSMAIGVSSEYCVGCFHDIREKFMMLMIYTKRKGVNFPPDIRNLILIWITVNEA
jgi:hypothetical protein